MFSFGNLNQATIGMCKLLIEKGISRKTRGFDCIEIPHPVTIAIENPCDRYITIPERKWNKTFGFVESLWIASGRNDVEMVSSYVENLKNFSDDGKFERAGYGPRIRSYKGIAEQYKENTLNSITRKAVYSNIDYFFVVDQLKFVVQKLTQDPQSRQAVISIHDPAADDFNFLDESLLVTKDQPCTRLIQFMVVDNKLDCTVYIRSNDVLWGFSAVNVFNFTFMQEYVSLMLGIPVGKYYHIANNLHFYENMREMVEKISKRDPDEYQTKEKFYYREVLNLFDLSEFDQNIIRLSHIENDLRTLNSGKKHEKGITPHDIRFSNYVKNGNKNEFFDDWKNVFVSYWRPFEEIKFVNPILSNLFQKKETK